MKFYKACLHLQTLMSPTSPRLSGIFRKLSECRTYSVDNMSLHTRRCFCSGAVKQNMNSAKGYETLYTNSTIFSLSSGHGKCGVAVVRLSGSCAYQALEAIALLKVKPKPRVAILRQLVDPDSGVTIDKGLVLYFPGPHSFTGEDCVEFQVHGGPAVVSALLSALYKIPKCRQAEPGEFTKRAFLNGKMDLTEIEGLGDLIHAETEVQRCQALRQMDGDLSKLYRQWRSKIIKCVADLEAFIDFSEDQDIEEAVVEQVKQSVQEFSSDISHHLNDNRQGEILREGVHVVIIGEPNVGKSSLLNSICQRPAAIVTNVAGTTRDLIETHVNIGGYPVLLSDTAGLRDTHDVVEKEGVSRAIRRAKEADLRIIVLDSMSQAMTDDSNMYKLIFDQFKDLIIGEPDEDTRENDITTMKQSSGVNWKDDNTIVVFNKIDLVPKSHISEIQTLILETDKAIVTQEETFNEYNKNTPKPWNINENSLTDTHGSLYGNHEGHDLFSYASHIENRRQQCNKMVDNSLGLRNTLADSSSEAEGLYKSPTYNQFSFSVSLRSNGVRIPCCFVSCVHEDGMDCFLEVLRTKVAEVCGNPLAGHPSLTQSRHRAHLVKCLQYLDEFKHLCDKDDLVLASETLRWALQEIGKITGKISSEEILDVIFRDFCIGK